VHEAGPSTPAVRARRPLRRRSRGENWPQCALDSGLSNGSEVLPRLRQGGWRRGASRGCSALYRGARSANAHVRFGCRRFGERLHVDHRRHGAPELTRSPLVCGARCRCGGPGIVVGRCHLNRSRDSGRGRSQEARRASVPSRSLGGPYSSPQGRSRLLPRRITISATPARRPPRPPHCFE
jgi:hypothetical protein